MMLYGRIRLARVAAFFLHTLFLLLCLSPVRAMAEGATDVSVPAIDVAAMVEHQIPLGRYFLYTVAPQNDLTLADLLEPELVSWQPSQEDVPNFGLTPDTYWFKGRLTNSSSRHITRLLEISYPVLDYVDLYLVHDQRVLAHYKAGDRRPFHVRPLDNRHFLFELEVPPNGTIDLFLQVQSEGSLQVPATLWESRIFMEQDQRQLSLQMLFAGLMLSMAIYNLLILLVVREQSYIWYVLNVVSYSIFQMSLQGLTFQFLWPEWPLINAVVVSAAIALNLMTVAMFTDTVLKLRTVALPLHYLMRGFATVGGVLFILAFMLDYAIVIKVDIILVAIFAPTVTLIGIYCWWRGDVLARLFTLAWLLLVFGNTALALNKYGLLPAVSLFEHSSQIGAAAEVLLLSFALAYRITQERRLREAAQRESAAAQHQLLEAQIHLNEDLDRMVRARTEELQAANIKLEEMSSTDGLTGLRNRRYFDEVLAREYSRAYREGLPISVLIFDIDFFKKLNDTHGHLFGDLCLIRAARLIEADTQRSLDTAARYGGEEFVMLLPNTDMAGAVVVAHSIRDAFRQTVVEDGDKRARMTVSIGVASLVPDTLNAHEELLRLADHRLYRAKENGRDRVEWQEDQAAG